MTAHLTPQGHVRLADDPVARLDAAIGERIAAAFARGSGHGLLHLGAAEVETPLPVVLAYWRDVGSRYVTAAAGFPAADPGKAPRVPAPPVDALAKLAAAAPPMTGSEYLTADVLARAWSEMDDALHTALAESGQTLQSFLHARHPAWKVVGRVHFNLAEYRLDPETPFAFLSTYTTSLSRRGRAQHAPLGRALDEYAGAKNKARLLSLLAPVQRAADAIGWLRQMVDDGDVFHALRWNAAEAYRFLMDVPALERAGIIVRLPAAWRTGRPLRPRATAVVGTKTPSGLGTDALLDFSMAVTLDGQALTRAEVDDLLAGADGLRLLRGQWVEVRRDALERMIGEFARLDKLASEGGLAFAEAMRLSAGAAIDDGRAAAPEHREWSDVVSGPWLRAVLDGLRAPDGLAGRPVDGAVHATLRPYQEAGVRWLRLLSSLGLGACLADDMGLGKTLQVLAWLASRPATSDAAPALVVAPASLLATWAAEAARFTPTLRVLVAHPSAIPGPELKTLDPLLVDRVDLVITSYASLYRVPWIAPRTWSAVVLDEAQAIKNPAARQTRAARGLASRARVALTGTPVENRLTDLWSIFDVINPGLLGTHQAFAKWTKRLQAEPHASYAPLRALVAPYILRRMKTDPAVIADLPAKTEVAAWCGLSARQATLYQRSVDELAAALERSDGIVRKGLVLSYLTRFKQIANHPSHWLGDDRWREDDSGKFRRLRELAETMAARQEKVLVFTQFREITDPLAAFLASVFGRPGLVLHGGTPVARRRELVRRFQTDEDVPFFVLSLTAGGTGLTLTAATQVIHFDRWWNPAVENQATDRAFRIGQTRPVLVHKFVCRGTVEERINDLIETKRGLSARLLESGAEIPLTELSNDEILRLVSLDLRQATMGGE